MKKLLGVPLCQDCEFEMVECWKQMNIPKWCQKYFAEEWIGNKKDIVDG